MSPALTRLLPFALLPALVFSTARPAASPTLRTGPGGATVYAAPRLAAMVYAAPRLAATMLAHLPDNRPLRVSATAASINCPGSVAVSPAACATGVTVGASQTPTPVMPQLSTPVTPQLPLPYAGARAVLPLVARGLTRVPVYLRALPAFGARRIAVLPRVTPLTVDAWAIDAGGAAWYHATTTTTIIPATTTAGLAPAPLLAGWVYGDAMTFNAGAPVSLTALLAPLRGKGMWFTYPLLQTTPVTTIVAMARGAGLSHLYVEVGRSNKGFYGGPGLDALLPAAHRAGIRVIAWVYPFLRDVPADVAMSVAAARYTAPSGDRPDGLLTDVEDNMDEGAVRAYGQVLRATLGPDALMAIATFPPQWSSGRTYPFATAALSWTAVVPMDYWHLRRRAYTAAEAYNFVSESVALIRARTRPDMPVEVLGQMFDIYQSGANSPSAAEILACAAAARDTGALGVSFFEWRHATPEEWSALQAIGS